MYNEVHFIVSVYLSLSLQYNKVFEYARNVCAVPFDTAEALLDGYCLMMAFQCIVQEKKKSGIFSTLNLSRGLYKTIHFTIFCE